MLAGRIDGHLGLGHQRRQDRLQVRGKLLLERVESHFRPRGPGLFDLGQGGLDLLVIRLGGHHNQPLVGRIDGDLGLGNQPREQRHHVAGEVLFQRIKTQLGLGRLGLLDLGQGGLDLLVIRRRSRHDQSLVGCVGGDLGLGNQPRKQRHHVAGEVFFQRIEPQLGLGRFGLLDLGKRRLDFLVVIRRGHHHQPPVSRVEGDLRLGNQPREQRHHIAGEVLFQRIKTQLGLGRFGLLDLGQGGLDLLVIRRRGRHHQPLIGRVGGDLRLGCQLSQQCHHVAGEVLFQRIKTQLGHIGTRFVRLELLQGVLDHGLIGRHGHRDQVARLRVDREIRLRHKLPQKRLGGRGIDLAQRVDLDRGRVLRRIAVAQRLDRALDPCLFLRVAPDDQLARGGVQGEFGAGHQFFQPGQQRLRHGRGASRRPVDLVGLEPPLPVRRQLAGDVGQGLLDRLVFGGRGPNQQLPAAGVDDHSRVGKQFLEHLLHVGRIGRLDLVGNKLIIAPRGGLVPFQFLQDSGDGLLIRRAGPNGKLARPRVGQHGHARQLARQAAENRRKPLSLRPGDGVIDQLFPFRRLGRLELVDRLFEFLVVFRRGHHHQPAVLWIVGHLGLGNQLRQNRGDRVRILFFQCVEPQLGRVGPRLGRLQLFHNGLDLFVLAGQGQHDQTVRFRVVIDFRAREKRLEHAHHGRGISPRDGINLHRGRFIGVGNPSQLLDRRLDDLVFRVGGKRQQLGRVLVVGEHRARNHRLQGRHEAGFGRGRLPAGNNRAHAIGLQVPLLFRRKLGVHVLQHALDYFLKSGRGVNRQLPATGVVGNRGRAGHRAEHLLHRRGVRLLGEWIELQLRRRRCGFRFGLLGRWLRYRLDHRADRPHHARRIGHQQLPRRRQRHHLAVRSQQRRDLVLHHRGILAAQGKLHGDQLEPSPLVQFVQLDPRDHPLRNALRKVDHHQHLVAANQRVTLGQKHPVEDVDRLGGRVLAGVGVVERARRRLVDHQRKVRLLGKPLQHVGPKLEAKVEPQLALGQLVGPLGQLLGGEQGGQLLLGVADDFHAGRLVRLGERLRPLGHDRRDLRPLLVGQFHLPGDLRLGQPGETGLWIEGANQRQGFGNRRPLGRSGCRRGRRTRRGGCLFGRCRGGRFGRGCRRGRRGVVRWGRTRRRGRRSWRGGCLFRRCRGGRLGRGCRRLGRWTAGGGRLLLGQRRPQQPPQDQRYAKKQNRQRSCAMRAHDTSPEGYSGSAKSQFQRNCLPERRKEFIQKVLRRVRHLTNLPKLTPDKRLEARKQACSPAPMGGAGDIKGGASWGGKNRHVTAATASARESPAGRVEADVCRFTGWD